MANLKNKTKAELIDIIKSLNTSGTEDVCVFAEHLKNYFLGYQSGVFTKYEILTIINKVYDAFIFAKGAGKDEENNLL